MTTAIIIGIIINLVVIYLTITGAIPFGLTFSGRKFVWSNAILHIFEKPLLGFGIDGVLLTTFWTKWSGQGFNYAHNQILQNLIDGGVILCISFWLMMFIYASYIDRLEVKKYRVLSNSILSVLLFVMIFDSTTVYCYMFIFLSILVKLPQVVNERK